VGKSGNGANSWLGGLTTGEQVVSVSEVVTLVANKIPQMTEGKGEP
jgi:hypothetical protein